MPSDYAAIRGEKSEDYIDLAERVSRDLVARLYGDRAHFVFELLQNAEDALYKRDGHGGSRRVCFTLDGDVVRFSHFGKLFDEKDVRSVCDLLRSTKHEMTEIGRFGIGFKSVGAMTDRPKIHSGDEHFEIRRYVLPFAVPSVGLESGETSIVLPLREADDHAEVESELAGLDARTLLFLREIDEIEWSVEGGRSGSPPRGASRLRPTASGASGCSAKRRARDPEEEAWLVFSREVHHEESRRDTSNLPSGSRRMTTARERSSSSGTRVSSCLLPDRSRRASGCSFRGRTGPRRPRQHPAGRTTGTAILVEETAGLLVEALHHLRDRGLLGRPRLRRAPAQPTAVPGGNPFAPMFDAVHEAIRSEPLLPTHKGGYVAASHARLTPSSGLRNLLSRPRLAELLGQDEPVAWLSGDIRRNTTLYPYLRREHGVEELTAASFLGSLDKRFLEAQPDGWIRRLYEFLHRERGEDAALGRALDDAWGIPPLVRLEDGTHTEPEDWSGDRLFLPTDPPLGLPNTVLPAVCDSEPALAFLKSLGVSEPDLVDELIPDVVDRYRDQSAVDPSAHPDDLRRIVEVFTGASGSARERLAEALRETFVVRAVDAGTEEPSFVRPRDVYLRTRRLYGLFNGVSGVLFPARPPSGVSAADMARLLEACGAWGTLAPVPSTAGARRQWESEYQDLLGYSSAQRARWRQRAGWPSITFSEPERVTDYEFHGLKELLEYLPTMPAEDHARRAGLLWDDLRRASERRDRSGFKGRYEWYYYTDRSYQFDSASVRLLNEATWVPDGSGGLRPPADVLFDSLGWEGNQFLELVIKFRRPAPLRRPDFEATARARQAGYSEDDIAAWIDQGMKSRQRADAGGERSSTPRTGGGQPPRRSFIGVERESEPTEEGSREHDRRMGLEKEAIALIQKQEPSLKRTPPNNPGFDLCEVGEEGAPVRWIEVKALSEGWESRPVTLTHTQFDYARAKGEAYWLYVVEHAGTDGARIVGIQNPAGRDSTYTFDHGWRAAAERTNGDG